MGYGRTDGRRYYGLQRIQCIGMLISEPRKGQEILEIEFILNRFSESVGKLQSEVGHQCVVPRKAVSIDS
jgi:hypothetical protein